MEKSSDQGMDMRERKKKRKRGKGQRERERIDFNEDNNFGDKGRDFKSKLNIGIKLKIRKERN